MIFDHHIAELESREEMSQEAAWTQQDSAGTATRGSMSSDQSSDPKP